MANELASVTLSQISLRITKGTTPTTLGYAFTDCGVNFVKSEAITDEGWIDVTKFGFIDRSTHEALQRSILQEGDVLFSMAGVYLGKTAVVPRSILPANTNQAVGIIRLDTRKADPRFVHYSLSAPDCRSFVRRSVSQSAQPNFNLRDIGDLRIPSLSLHEQRAIAGVLRALDDKIESNRRTSRTLEKLARAIFRAWFVDFEPVKAKVAGARSFPGMPQEAFDALPTRLVPSELGPIPEGWRVQPLNEAVEVNPPRKLGKGVVAPYLEMAQMPTDGHAPTTWADREAGSGARFMNGDTLVARITPCLENGKTAFVDSLNEGQVAWGSTEYIVLRPKPPIPDLYAYLLARTPEFRAFAIQNMTGTSGRQRVPFNTMSKFNVAIGPSPVMKAFGDAVGLLFTRSSASVRESRSLAAMRDYLLPNLLSGEVRVPWAERFVEDAL